MERKRKTTHKTDPFVGKITNGRTFFNAVNMYLYFKKGKREKGITPTKIIKRSIFFKICSEYNELIMREVMFNGLKFGMHGLGEIYLTKFIPEVNLNKEGKIVNGHKLKDYFGTINLWRKDLEAKKNKVELYFNNEHSGGYRYKFNANLGKKARTFGFKRSRTTRIEFVERAKNNEIKVNYK